MNNDHWYCCGLRRGSAEIQCHLCNKLQPNVRIPSNTILLKECNTSSDEFRRVKVNPNGKVSYV